MAYSLRLIVVMRAAFAAQANTAAKLVDTVGGERTFSGPALRLAGDATNQVRARWCSWQMTPAQATALRTRLQEAGLLNDEVVIVQGSQEGTFVPNAQARCYIFDAREGQWSPEEVLAVLNLETIPTPL